jgi:hypothetical protein
MKGKTVEYISQKKSSQPQWFTPIIPATREASAGRSQYKIQSKNIRPYLQND